MSKWFRRRWWSTGALHSRSFRLLAAGQFTSSIGDAFYAIALPWLVLTDGDGPRELGVVVAFTESPEHSEFRLVVR